ncbi:hypothetical protein C1J03_15520 [Sulfitobacter sp. SK012]|nr:hypothetical protein C1J03_15520 [Sulfitobacter sp. SK012]
MVWPPKAWIRQYGKRSVLHAPAVRKEDTSRGIPYQFYDMCRNGNVTSSKSGNSTLLQMPLAG